MRFFAKRLRILVFALLLVSPGAGYASESAPTTVPVHFTASVSPSPIHPGELAIVKVAATIQPGFHIYSVAKTSGPGPIPTSITLNAPDLVQSVNTCEDTPTVRYDGGFQKNVAFHESNAVFTVPARLSASASPKTIDVNISVNYQACNAVYCNPPETVKLVVKLPVVLGPVRDSYRDEPHSTRLAATTQEQGPKSNSSNVGLLEFIATAFLAGLLALLTPCVFPLIPVTFGFFTKQLGAGGGKLIALAATYAFGIIVSFTALGLIVAATVGENGPNRIAANPWFNIVFGVLFIVFGFAFFETFTPRLPGFLQRFSRPMRAGSGYITVLFMGLAFVFAAFTCTAPFVATVLSLAVTASRSCGWLRPVLGMMSFSLALALPFFMLALFPSLLSKLPRSGSWLSVTKAVIGFIELALSVLYFSKADLVWQANVLTRPVIFGVWAAISVCGALYLFGVLKLSRYQEMFEQVSFGRVIGAVLFLGAACYCFYAQTGRPINAVLGSFLPPPGYGGVGEQSTVSIEWLNDFDAARSRSIATGQPLFIDFTGYTCTNCRWMELNIFPEPDVAALLKKFVTVRLYTDGGVDGPKNQALQSSLTGEVAQPLYAVLSSDGRKVAQRVGLDANAHHFAAFLAQGLNDANTSSHYVGSFLPAGKEQSSARSRSQPITTKAWAQYEGSVLSQARKSHKPVIVDFSADWCIPCHAIERTVFRDPDVLRLTPKFQTYKVNLTDYYGASSMKIEDQFGIEALPTIVFVDASGKETPGTRVTGIIKPADFVVRMQKTLRS